MIPPALKAPARGRTEFTPLNRANTAPPCFPGQLSRNRDEHVEVPETRRFSASRNGLPFASGCRPLERPEAASRRCEAR